MAIDSARKRKSAAQMAVSHGPVAVVPDSSFAAADRQTIGWGYYGILVGEEAPAADTLSVFMMFIDP